MIIRNMSGGLFNPEMGSLETYLGLVAVSRRIFTVLVFVLVLVQVSLSHHITVLI